MANIESRRIKRKAARIALPVLAGLLVCAVIAALVFLPKALKTGGGEADVDIGSSEPTESAVTPQSTEGTPSVTEGAKETAPVIPTASVVSPEQDIATNVPGQTTEDRSLLYYLVDVSMGSGADPAHYAAVSGSCAVSFVNNTDSPMFAAYFNMEGCTVTKASVNGAAIRFENDEGIAVLPFVRELMPGETAELYFEFEGSAYAPFCLPHPAYDTVFDASGFISSDRPLSFSPDGAELDMQSGAYVYRLNAERTEAVAFSPA